MTSMNCTTSPAQGKTIPAHYQTTVDTMRRALEDGGHSTDSIPDYTVYRAILAMELAMFMHNRVQIGEDGLLLRDWKWAVRWFVRTYGGMA